MLKTNKKLTVFCFDNVDDAFKYIIQKHKFREIKENLNKITFFPISCIFTSFNLAKEIVTNKNKYKHIKSFFYNKDGVKTNFIDCINFFKEYSIFYKTNIKNIFYQKMNKSYDGCLTFEQIYSKNQFVLPFLYNEFMESGIKLIPN